MQELFIEKRCDKSITTFLNDKIFLIQKYLTY
jgi:hypothetical protein